MSQTIAVTIAILGALIVGALRASAHFETGRTPFPVCAQRLR